MTRTGQRHLPRLAAHRYQGHAFVFWTLTVEGRARGWLTDAFHAAFREVLLHAAVRQDVWCPVYCLMPDHVHLVWMGMDRGSDQLRAMRFVRRMLAPRLGPGRAWQWQAHDHVLLEAERERGAFMATCEYIRFNPVRAGLVERPEAWPHAGCIVPGYPVLDPALDAHWDLYWRLHAARLARPDRGAGADEGED